MPGVAWNAGHVRLAARRDPGRAREVHAADRCSSSRRSRSELALAGAYDRITPISIDHAVMEGAAADHRVVMGAMDVGWSDLGSWTALLAALGRGDGGRGATGRVVQPGETVEVGPDDLVVRPRRRAARRRRPPGGGYDRRPTASGPTSPAPAHLEPRSRRSSTASPARRSARDEHRRGAGPDDDRLRHRRLAGRDRRRLHVRERPALRRRRRPLRRRARRAGEGRRRRLRPPVRLGALRRGRRRGPPRPRHPGRLRRPAPCRPRCARYEVVERGAAAGIVITASHNPWTDNGFKVKSPTGSAAGPEILDGPRGRDRRERRRRDRAPAVRRRRGGRPRRAVRPVRGLRALPPPDGRPRRAEGGRHQRSSSSRCTAPARAGSRGCSPAAGSGSPRSTRSATRTSAAINPEPIRPNVDEALGIIAGGGYDLGLLLDGDADRAGAADEQGTFIHQLQVTGLLMYYLAEHRGLREPVVDQRQQHVDGGAARRALRDRDVHETSVGFKYIGPKMIETGAMMGAEESGGYGFGMHLPERDGIYADLLLLDLFLREKAAGRWPVSKAIAHFHEIAGPSFYRADRRPRRPRDAYPEVKQRLLVDLVAQRADGARRPARRADRSRSTRTTASSSSSPTGRGCSSGRQRHRAARPRLHRGDVARRPARRCSRPASGWSAARDARPSRPRPRSTGAPARRVEKPWGHELIWAETDRYAGKVLVIETGRRLSLQYHERKDESIYVLAGPSPAATSRTTAGEMRSAELGPGEQRARAGRAAPPLRGARAGRADRGLDAGARRRRPDRGRLRPRGHVGARSRRSSLGRPEVCPTGRLRG